MATQNQQIIDPKTGKVTYASGSNIDTTNTTAPIISVDGLGATTPSINVPTPIVDNSLNGAMAGATSYTTSNPPPVVKSAGEVLTEGLKNVPVVDENAIRSTLEANAGLTEKATSVRNLKSQIDAINAEANAATQSLESGSAGKDVTSTFLGKQQQEIQRQASIKTLPLTAQYQAESGDYQAAKDSVDKVFTATVNYEKAVYDNKVNALNAAYTVANDEEKKALDKKALEYSKEKDAREILNTQRSDAMNAAVKAGDYKTAGLIASATDSASISKYLGTIKVSGADALDIAIKQAQLDKLKKETSLLGEPTAAEKKAEVAAMKEAKSSIPVLQNKITDANDILTNSGMASRVGTNFLTRKTVGEGFVGGVTNAIGNVVKAPLTLGVGTVKDIAASVSGSGQDFSASVHKLVGGMTLQNLIDAKSRGATFGALSEGELSLLASSATKINDWEIKDSKGNGIGVWDIDEKSFKKEIDFIKSETARALQLSGQSVLADDENKVLDSVYGSNTVLSADNYFK